MAVEIAKLVVAWSSRFAKDLDREDLVQETTLAILRRNPMPSAFDPTRGSFGRYVTMVARNVAGHLRHKRDRHEAAATAELHLARLSRARVCDPYAAETTVAAVLDRRRALAILEGGAS